MANGRPNMFQVAALQQQLNSPRSSEVTTLQRLKREYQFADVAIRSVLAAEMKEQPFCDAEQASYLGQHMLAEFRVSTAFKKQLDDSIHPEKILHKIIVAAAKFSGAHMLTDTSYIQQGTRNISVIVPVEESHYAIHYRGDSGFLALDAFTCGEIDFMKAVDYIKQQIGAQPYDTTEFKRGIRDADNKFIPGIAVVNQGAMSFFKAHAVHPAVASLGQHMIAEFYHCNRGRINNPQVVVDTFGYALEAGGATARYQFVHRFQPQGVTAVVTGDGFHLTIHDWPEYGYASIDLCAFDSNIDMKKVMNYLEGHFDARKTSVSIFPRGNFSAATSTSTPQVVFAELSPKLAY